MLYRSYVFGPFNSEDLDETENREKEGNKQKRPQRAATMRMHMEHDELASPAFNANSSLFYIGSLVCASLPPAHFFSLLGARTNIFPSD